MRPVRALGLYLVLVFVGGALIAPWLYDAAQAVAGVFPSLNPIAQKPFPRYLTRSLLVLALAGLWPLLHAVGICSWREVGLGRRPGALRQALWGFLCGLLSLAGIVLIVLAFGARSPSHEHAPAALVMHFLKAALAAIFVAPLEEIVFRGALFGALRKSLHWVLALVLSSAVYALVHFLERAQPLPRVDWSSGFTVLLGMVSGFGDLEKLIPGFFNLALAGIILGLAYQRTGALYYSIGLHAGWIFWLKTYKFATEDTAAGRAWFFGTDKLINGWLALIILGLVLVWLSRSLAQQDPHIGWKERRLFN